MADEFAPDRRTRFNVLALLALIIAIAALVVALRNSNTPTVARDGATAQQSTLQRVNTTRVLRVGYEGYPPYTVIDPQTQAVSGYSVDVATAIATEAEWKVQWVKTTPDTKVADLAADKFDVMVEPIFRTIPRATRASFTRPYSYFGYAAGVVRKGDTRFRSMADLNRPGIKVVVRLGYTDQTYAEQHLPQAQIVKLNASDISQVFNEVLAGRADIALADLEQVKAFASTHAGSVDTLFTDPPPAAVPAGFMLRQGDFAFYNFLNSAIDYLESNGVFDDLDRKYKVTALREKRALASPVITTQ